MAKYNTGGILFPALILGFFCGAAPPSCEAQISASVTVDTTTLHSVFPENGLGIHTSPYYNQLGNNSLDERIEESGIRTLRYGGGGYADVFHWSIAQPQWVNGITGGGLSPWFGEEGNFGYVGPGSDFATFVDLLDRTDNSRAVVTVNYGSALKLVNGQSAVPDFGGQPKEAAAWVAYANSDASIYGTDDDIPLGVDEQGNDWKTAGYWARLRASSAFEYQTWATADGVYDSLNSFLAIDREEPVGIEHWEIGNETFGTAYYDNGGVGYSVDYDVPYDGTNRENHPDLSPAKYGQDLVEYAELMRQVDPSIKIGAVLATPPNDYDWSYADLNNNNRRDSNEPFWNDEVLANAADEIDFVMVHWYPYIGENSDGSSLVSQVPNTLRQMIEGSTPGLDTGTNAGVRDSLAAYGIPDAEIMVTEFNYFGSHNPTYEDAAEAIFVADAYATWLELGVESVQYLELLTKDFLDDNNGLARGSAFHGVSAVDKLGKPGDEFVDADSSNSSVRTHAVLQEDGSVAVMLLNTHLSNSASVTVDIEGVSLMNDGAVYTVLGGLALVEQDATGLSGPFTVDVPARTIAVYVIPALAGDFNADGVVDAADYTVWRDGLGDQYTEADYTLWANNLGRTAFDGVPGFSVPEPSSAVCLICLAGSLAARRRR